MAVGVDPAGKDVASGGIDVTARGTEKGIRVHRRDSNGTVHVSEMKMNDLVERDDVIYVKESLF